MEGKGLDQKLEPFDGVNGGIVVFAGCTICIRPRITGCSSGLRLEASTLVKSRYSPVFQHSSYPYAGRIPRSVVCDLGFLAKGQWKVTFTAYQDGRFGVCKGREHTTLFLEPLGPTFRRVPPGARTCRATRSPRKKRQGVPVSSQVCFERCLPQPETR